MANELNFIVGAVTRIEEKLDRSIEKTADQGERISKIEGSMTTSKWTVRIILTIMGLTMAGFAIL